MFWKWWLLLEMIRSQSPKCEVLFQRAFVFKPKVKSNTLFFRVHLRTCSRAFLKLWHAHFSFSENCEDREESSYCGKETCDSQMVLFLMQTACEALRTSLWSSLGKTTSNQPFINIMSMTYHPHVLPSSLLTWGFKRAVLYQQLMWDNSRFNWEKQ